jgi:hypothetical protein
MARTPAWLSLDIEDPITMRSHRAAQWMCEEIASFGLTATCFLVAAKVREWERLGLRDVIESVKQHDLHFHSTGHSFHPTISELSESLAAEDGAEMLWGWERPGWDEAERIMGAPLQHWNRTGGSWSPALARMLGKRGRATKSSAICHYQHRPRCWFAGGLNFGGSYGGLDGVYHNAEEFEPAFARHKARADELLDAGVPYLGLFAGHPTRLVHRAFWDTVNFSEGRIRTPEDFENPEPITAEEEKVCRRNFRRTLEWMVGDDRFEIMGFSELVRLFNAQKSGCSRAEVEAICTRICEQGEVTFTDAFSAAEIMGLMLDYVTTPEAELLYRRDIMSPENMGGREPGVSCSPGEALKTAAIVNAHVTASRVLPDVVSLAGVEVSIATYFVALARAICMSKAGQDGAFSVTAPPPYPAIGDELAEAAATTITSWSIHRPTLDLSCIIRGTKLLSWTYKPAWTREELSRIDW